MRNSFFRDHTAGCRQPVDRAGRAHGVHQQARDRHRPDAARHRRDRARDLGGLRVGDVADDAVLAARAGDAVDADIDHGRARLDPVAADHLGPPDRREQQVGAAADGGQVARPGMRHRDGRVLVQQQLNQRLADDVGAPDHHGFHPFERTVHRPGEMDAAERRARGERRQSGREPAGIHRMESVHVLGGVDRVQYLLAVDLLRQRQLHQDAVHRRIGVELPDQRQHLALRRVLGKLVIERAHAGFDRLLRLVAHIDGAGRILADQHDREAGHDAERRDAPHFGRDRGAQLGGNRLSVDDLCRHVLSSLNSSMAGLVPAIHAFSLSQDVDARHKAEHDDTSIPRARSSPARPRAPVRRPSPSRA